MTEEAKELVNNDGKDYLALNRFNLCQICNIDEVPLPYEFLDGYTYDLIGSKIVSLRGRRPGWEKRQASLILGIWADRVPRTKPLLLFRVKPDGRLAKGKEKLEYAQGVSVEFNKKAWGNSEQFNRWLKKEYLPYLNSGEGLLIIDTVSFHKTPEILKIVSISIRNTKKTLLREVSRSSFKIIL
jgi:hypothetical protein